MGAPRKITHERFIWTLADVAERCSGEVCGSVKLNSKRLDQPMDRVMVTAFLRRLRSLLDTIDPEKEEEILF